MIRNELLEYMKKRIGEINSDNKIKEAMEYSLISDGKLIRPLVFLILISKEKNYKEYFNVAMALECIHVYSLIHDDLPAMDNDDYRRGRLTNHKVYGEDIAILAGDSLLTFAFELLAETNIEPNKLVEMIRLTANHSGVNGGMINGQVLDVNNEGRETIEILKQIHIQKTARLIQLPILLGLIVNGEEDKLDLGRSVGEHVGLIYQVQDDYLDAYGDEKLLGKKVGSDSELNKKTYVDFYSKEEIENMISEMTTKLKSELIKLDVPEELSQLLIKLSTREK